MLKLIVGKKGSGKTKQLISMVNESVTKTKGKVACIEKATKLTFDVHHGARLLNTDSYGISGYDAFYGFLAGIAASDYDVKEIYVDSVGKIAGSDPAALDALFGKIDALSEKEDIAFTMTLSMEASELAEASKKYVI